MSFFSLEAIRRQAIQEVEVEKSRNLQEEKRRQDTLVALSPVVSEFVMLMRKLGAKPQEVSYDRVAMAKKEPGYVIYCRLDKGHSTAAAYLIGTDGKIYNLAERFVGTDLAFKITGNSATINIASRESFVWAMELALKEQVKKIL